MARKKAVRKAKRNTSKRVSRKGWKRFLLPFFAVLTPLFLLLFATWFVFGPIKQSAASGFCWTNSNCSYYAICSPWHTCIQLACSPGARCSGTKTRIMTAAAHTCGIDHGFSCVKNSCGATCSNNADCGSGQVCSGCKCVAQPSCASQGGSCYQLRCPASKPHEISGSCPTNRPMTCCK